MPKYTVIVDALLSVEVEADGPDQAKAKWDDARHGESEWEIAGFGRVMALPPDRVYVLDKEGQPAYPGCLPSQPPCAMTGQ
jgi:hypothetical protein